ncbi:Uncharacterized protein APZ42_018267 [Daphnia magna]|uniref:Reverse transcriptase domain-containing protein n=1 Tax=Daphnia magna TaxID=35525 RepID=A0A164Z7W9_9CRUS|nr:Uncharacterized protein APZ42_018267 [Daphnia magna]
MFNHILERESLTSSQGQAAIRLIPKSSVLCGISNFWPISLLNSDYIVIASVLAKRLRQTLSSTIGPHQKGAVPGRLIFVIFMLYGDVIQFVDDRHDSSKFRFEVWALPLLEFTLKRPTTWLTGKSSGGFWMAWAIELLSSVGCPLSLHLFVVYIEPLLVRLSRFLQGILLFNEKLTVTAFVDDVTIFISCDEDFTRAGQVLDFFCKCTKARMNKEKTKALGFGIWSSRLTWTLKWIVSAPTLSLLGNKFSHSIVDTADKVWNYAFGYLNDLGKVERPNKTVIYRPVSQGGMEMFNQHLFYRPLFFCSTYKVLTGASSPESSLLRYWMALPLRTVK